MSYTHNKMLPVVLKNDPVDPNDEDWIYFSYGAWLRNGETVTAHSAICVGGTVITDSTYLGTMTDSEGVEFTEVYGVKFKPNEGAMSVLVTHRKTTMTTGPVNLGRTSDMSALMAVKTL